MKKKKLIEFLSEIIEDIKNDNISIENLTQVKDKNNWEINIKINKKDIQKSIIWDNKDETIEKISLYLLKKKGKNWECGRCIDNKDVLYIIRKNELSTSSFYYYPNDIVYLNDERWKLIV